MTTEKVAIVIPALNEEGALRSLLVEIPGEFARWIIVVDNASTDATAAVANAAGAIVASEPIRGYGRACLQGLKTACGLGAEIVIFMDGDGSDDPADLPMMLAPVSEGHAELVIGSRVSKRSERGAVPPQARLGNWLVSRMIRILYGVHLHDIGSFRVIRCSSLDTLKMREMTFGWPVEMLVKAARARYRIVELPIHYRHRSHGRSKVAGTIVGGLKAAYYMLRTTLRYAGARGRRAYCRVERSGTAIAMREGGHMSDTALVVMARYPQAGKTKTRLARTIGDDETIRLYRAFLIDLAQRFAGQEYILHWAYTPAEVDYSAFVATLASSLAQHTRCFPQQGADLGARLHSVFKWTHEQQFQRTIVIGSDSPHISLAIVASAWKALDEADIVLGPADDGGYYLIAMRRPYEVFSGIPMSTSVVTEMTIELAQRQGLTVRLLEPLFDIDELSDLLRLAQLLETDSTLAPATAAYLATIRSLHAHNARGNPATLDLYRTDQSL